MHMSRGAGETTLLFLGKVQSRVPCDMLLPSTTFPIESNKPALPNRRGKAPVIHAGDESAVPYWGRVDGIC